MCTNEGDLIQLTPPETLIAHKEAKIICQQTKVLTYVGHFVVWNEVLLGEILVLLVEHQTHRGIDVTRVIVDKRGTCLGRLLTLALL